MILDLSFHEATRLLAHDIAKHLPRLRRIAESLCRDRSLAEDLVQDTMERALRHADKFRPGTCLEAWLTTILKNLLANHVRQRCTRRHLLALVPFETHAAGGQFTRLRLLDLKRALGRLHPSERAALFLLGIEGISYSEAALRMGVPAGTVRSRASRARTRLFEAIEGEPFRRSSKGRRISLPIL